MKPKELIIMYDDPQIVTPHTQQGFKGLDGHFWPDEHMARWSSCTHLKCDCGKVMSKSWTKCDDCRHKMDVEKYNSMPRKPHDGQFPLALFRGDEFFFDEDALYSYCDEQNLQPSELMLVFCTADYGPEVTSEIFADHTPEDWQYDDLDPDVLKAMDALNKVIRDNGPYCWWPDKVVVEPSSLPTFNFEKVQ